MDGTLLVFTGIVAAALLMQSFALLGMYRSLRSLSARLEEVSRDVSRSVDSVAGRVGDLLNMMTSLAEKLQVLENSLAGAGEMVQKRVADLDAFIGDATNIARLQVARIQDLVETATRRIEDTFETLHQSVLAPINEISAIIRGIRVGLDLLFRRRKGPSSASPQDEEMFI